MKSGTIANSNRLATSVALEVCKLYLWKIRLTADTEHDWQSAILRKGVLKSIGDEIHVGFCFGLETHAQKYVDREG